jgi:hypothetical protein
MVAVDSLMAMVGGTLAALVMGKNDPGFVHNGPLARWPAWSPCAPAPTSCIRWARWWSARLPAPSS